MTNLADVVWSQETELSYWKTVITTTFLRNVISTAISSNGNVPPETTHSQVNNHIHKNYKYYTKYFGKYKYISSADCYQF